MPSLIHHMAARLGAAPRRLCWLALLLLSMPLAAFAETDAAGVGIAAIEVVDSRIAGWDISILDTVADNASSGTFVLGGAPRRLTDIDDLREVAMELACDGEVLSSGVGAQCLGHPVNAVVWLANAVGSRGAPLQAGEVILSGSLGPLVTVERGRTYEAAITGLGTVRATFA